MSKLKNIRQGFSVQQPPYWHRRAIHLGQDTEQAGLLNG